MPQLHDVSFLLEYRGIEKTIDIMVLNQCDVIACRANGIKQEEQGGVASLCTICSIFCTPVVTILKSESWGRISQRATRPGHGLEKALNKRHGRYYHAFLSIFTPVYMERNFCQ